MRAYNFHKLVKLVSSLNVGS